MRLTSCIPLLIARNERPMTITVSGTILALAFGMSMFAISASAEELSGHAEIIDGDTIRVGQLSVRLEGIDAPEIRQDCEMPDGTSYDCGAEAAAFLAKLINGASVSCDTAGQDRYGRILGICHTLDVNLNAEMVRSGRALAFRKYSDLYVPQEAQAEAERVGIWAGSFDYPWVWRADLSAGLSSEGCTIKGNISSSGERIYHMPFHDYYDRTRVSESRGERWFCTEDEAMRAGWRRALR